MEPERLGSLIDRHAAALELYARQWCETPEDVVQEAFLSLVRQRVEPDNCAAWLFRAVRNGAINASVAARRRRKHEAEAAVDAASWFETSPWDGPTAAVDPEAAKAELGRLPLEQREVIVAHLWGDLTFEEIARLVGRPSSTVHRLYQAGLAALRERLGVPCHTKSPRPIPN